MISVIRKFVVWLPPFPKIGDKPYFGIFGQIFVQMDEDTHPHQDKSGWPVHGRPGTQIYLFWKFFDCTAPVDAFLIDSIYSCQSEFFH